tara:strand:+ start:203 stop:364 length:162 start_codon:yes stop_codon:yes gene_type:complete
MDKVISWDTSLIMDKLEGIEKKLDEYDKILFFHLELLTDLNKQLKKIHQKEEK